MNRQLALCVVSALIQEGQLETDVTIPELAPDDPDDLADESESWRDNLDNNQARAVDELVGLLDPTGAGLQVVERIDCDLTGIYHDWDYAIDLSSLRGIEACTRLKQIAIRSTSRALDLAPLAALPALEVVNVKDAKAVKSWKPLLAIPRLNRVVGPIADAVVKGALRKRGVVFE